VLLGGGTAIQAGAVQVLVLIGLLAAETVTVVVAYQLMKASRLLPPDLRSRLIA
jgi:putative ABC transport system permease protein